MKQAGPLGGPAAAVQRAAGREVDTTHFEHEDEEMADFKGLFELITPGDLFNKLTHDLERLEADRLDQYAAFDFFVTAEHMLDWYYPNDPSRHKRERENNPLLQLCSHLANGSKHFRATSKRHHSVKTAEIHHGAFSNAFSDDFDISFLEIKLDGEAEARFGPAVDALDIARQLHRLWQCTLGLR